MKDVKLYNVIFPIWFLLFFPPVVLITLVGNYLIDSLVIIACFYLMKLSVHHNLSDFYKKSIIKVWLFGFVADIIGASILLSLTMTDFLPYEVLNSINYDPFSNLLAVVIIIAAMLVAGAFIFFFNYSLTFKYLIEEKTLRFKLALTIAILTIPWTFLLPTKWFY